MNLNTQGARRRTSGLQWPEFPAVPAGVRALPEGERWAAELQTMWHDFRAQLDRVTTGGRDLTIVNAGGNRILHYGSGPGGVATGVAGRGGGIVRRGPGDGLGGVVTDDGSFLPDGIFPSAEGGRYLVRLDGTRVFYQPVEPSEGRAGDLWYDTDNLYKLYRFEGGKWVYVFGDVPSLRGHVLPEFDARALLEQANAQAEALLAEVANRAAAIATVESALASETSATASRFTVLNAEVGSARARITYEAEVRAAADAVMASDIDTLEVDLGTAEAAIVTEREARIDADGSVVAKVATAISAGTGGASQSSGLLIVGATYKITANGGGADFTNVGAPDNNINTTFEATGTTPTAWGTGTLQQTNLAAVETWGVARVSAETSLGAEYVLNVVTGGTSGRRVAGFRVTNLGGAGGGTEFVVQTDKFIIVDTSGNIPTTPFKVSGGVVYIDKAVITEVTAAAIQAGTISVALELTAATITAGKIRSSAATDFSTTTGFYLGIDSGTPKFRIGNPAGARMQWDGTTLALYSATIDLPSISGGKLTLSGADSVVCANTADGTDDAIIRFNGGGGPNTVGNRDRGAQIDLLGNEYTTVAGYKGSLLLGCGEHSESKIYMRDRTGYTRVTVDGDMVKVDGELQAVSTSDPRSTSAPLYSAGGAWIEKSLDVRGGGYFNTTVQVAGILYALSDLDVTGQLYVDDEIWATGDIYTSGLGADRVGFLDAGGASGGDTYVGLRYNSSSNIAELGALTGGVAWRDVRLGVGATVWFGTYSALGAEALAGYITIKDDAGNTRKLAVIA